MTDSCNIAQQISMGTAKTGKNYIYDESHDSGRPAQMWFQESEEGLVLFIVFYTQACRWSRCAGCNLPMLMSQFHVSYRHIIEQIDYLFDMPEVKQQAQEIRKVIVSNNGSVLDEDTFSSTALMYLMAKFNLNLPRLAVVSLETRPEYVDVEELEFLSRALKEGDTPTKLELAVGFESYDEKVRNDIFSKGLSLKSFENMAEKLARYDFHLKCYFMLKPVPNLSVKDAIEDIHQAIAYLGEVSERFGLKINMHLNPTYAASGTPLATAFESGDFVPPSLVDVAHAALPAAEVGISLFVGLSDEGLAVPGGSFIRDGDDELVVKLKSFNQNQNVAILEEIILQANELV